jgi:hypothetical protein
MTISIPANVRAKFTDIWDSSIDDYVSFDQWLEKHAGEDSASRGGEGSAGRVRARLVCAGRLGRLAVRVGWRPF